jgi:hypothetical protein
MIILAMSSFLVPKSLFESGALSRVASPIGIGFRHGGPIRRQSNWRPYRHGVVAAAKGGQQTVSGKNPPDRPAIATGSFLIRNFYFWKSCLNDTSRWCRGALGVALTHFIGSDRCTRSIVTL